MHSSQQHDAEAFPLLYNQEPLLGYRNNLFIVNGPSFGNFPANVQWIPQNGFFQPVLYPHPYDASLLVQNQDIHAIASGALHRKEYFGNALLNKG